MKKAFCLLSILTILLFVCVPLFATHNAAGDIIYRFTSANTIQVSVITYTKQSSIADRDSLPIHWGDGSPDAMAPRINGPLGTGGIPNGEPIVNGYKKNIYESIHTYTPAAPGNYYVISMTDPNRSDGIINISAGNSANVQFYLEDTVWFSGQGQNSSPILLYPPLDFANVGDTFFHNPTAYDLEADSLTFDMVSPLQGLNNVVPGYIFPDQVTSVPGETLTIDKHNGMVTWASPQRSGIYDIAIMIREYRDGILLGTVTRDMLIVVLANSSKRAPLSGPFIDMTITPGQHFDLTCSAPDTDAAHSNTLTAYGGPFTLGSNAAVFSSTPAHQPTGIMTWTPARNQYKPRETHIITIRSVSSDLNSTVTLRSFLITVADTTVTGISATADSHDFVKIRGNPVQDILSVSSSTMIVSADIYSMDGRLVAHSNNDGSTDFDIHITGLSSGSYILSAKDKQGNVGSVRFQIMR